MTKEEADIAQRCQLDVICTRNGNGDKRYKVVEFIRHRDTILNNQFAYSVYLKPLSGNSWIKCNVYQIEFAEEPVSEQVKSGNSDNLKDLIDIAQRYNVGVLTENKDCQKNLQYKIKEFIRRGNSEIGFTYFVTLWNKNEPKYALTDPVPIDEITIVPGWDKFVMSKLKERADKQAVESLKRS